MYEKQSYTGQERVPNECKYCRDENDPHPHREHIERGWYTVEEVVEQPVTYV
jgi:hypothetical protein